MRGNTFLHILDILLLERRHSQFL